MAGKIDGAGFGPSMKTPSYGTGGFLPFPNPSPESAPGAVSPSLPGFATGQPPIPGQTPGM